jgi:hypothetical protein
MYYNNNKFFKILKSKELMIVSYFLELNNLREADILLPLSSIVAYS